MTPWRDLPIARKLALTMLVSSAAALSLAGTGIVAHDLAAMRATARQDGAALADVVALNSSAALSFADAAAAAETLAALAPERYVVSAELRRPDGTLFASWRRAEGSGDLQVARPVVHQGEALGSVVLSVGLEPYEERVARRVAILAAAILLSGSLMLGISLALQRPIVTSLGQLARAADEAAAGRGCAISAPDAGRDEVGRLVEAFNHMLGQVSERDELLRRANAELEARVRERTAELESFNYSVSHDLRAPLRHVAGFTQRLASRLGPDLGPETRGDVERIRGAVNRMERLIDGLLHLARLSRAEFKVEEVDLSALAAQVVAELRRGGPRRRVEVEIQPGLRARGDGALLQVLLQNLLGNAWKFTAKTPAPRVAFEATESEGRMVYRVRDNGAGFDMAHSDQLFRPFHRLHTEAEFAGTGIGLATSARIVARHGGRIWAESAPGQGATFFFTLGGRM